MVFTRVEPLLAPVPSAQRSAASRDRRYQYPLVPAHCKKQTHNLFTDSLQSQAHRKYSGKTRFALLCFGSIRVVYFSRRYALWRASTKDPCMYSEYIHSTWPPLYNLPTIILCTTLRLQDWCPSRRRLHKHPIGGKLR